MGWRVKETVATVAAATTAGLLIGVVLGQSMRWLAGGDVDADADTDTGGDALLQDLVRGVCTTAVAKFPSSRHNDPPSPHPCALTRRVGTHQLVRTTGTMSC